MMTHLALLHELVEAVNRLVEPRRLDLTLRVRKHRAESVGSVRVWGGDAFELGRARGLTVSSMRVTENSLPSPRAFDQTLMSDFCVTRALIVHLRSGGERGDASAMGSRFHPVLRPRPSEPLLHYATRG